MKNFFLIAFVSMMLTSCNNDSDDNILPAYAMEGKWVFPADIPGIGEQGISNTMYLFEDELGILITVLPSFLTTANLYMNHLKRQTGITYQEQTIIHLKTIF